MKMYSIPKRNDIVFVLCYRTAVKVYRQLYGSTGKKNYVYGILRSKWRGMEGKPQTVAVVGDTSTSVEKTTVILSSGYTVPVCLLQRQTHAFKISLPLQNRFERNDTVCLVCWSRLQWWLQYLKDIGYSKDMIPTIPFLTNDCRILQGEMFSVVRKVTNHTLRVPVVWYTVRLKDTFIEVPSFLLKGVK